MWNSRIARSQATTMKIRNKNGRSHAAFSALDTPLGPFASATSLSLSDRLFGEKLTRWINTGKWVWCGKIVPAKVRSPDERSDIRDASDANPGYRCAHPGFKDYRPRQINPTGKSIRIFRNSVKPGKRKYSALSATQISCSIPLVYRDKRGDRDRHERAVGCDGREGCD